MIHEFLALFENEVFSKAVHYFLVTWPFWAPIVFIDIAWHFWLDYIRRSWLNKQGSIFLEIKIPKDQPKSPAAMELVLQGIWENANISTPADAFWEGKLREWFSLEIVSVGGEVRFFIWAFPRWKKIIESRIYAQYPGAEVVEADDYALKFHYDPEKNYYTGVNTGLANKFEAFPINTYIEYELDKKKGDEQEEIIDPLTPVIEYLGTLKPGEVAVYQMIIRAHAKEDYLYGRLSTKKDVLDSGDVKAAIKNVIEKQAYIEKEKDKPASMMALTDDQKHVIAAIERKASKLAFDTMIRLFYTAPEGKEDKTRLMGMIGSMRQFGTKNMNGIKPVFFSFTHPWQDFNNIRKTERWVHFIDAIKRRAFFGEPHHHLFAHPYVLSTEEVATLYHFPGSTATTPNLRRAPSKKAEAPANLPV